MEKLIVKNFGPIKEAEIDLTKYVVFIGDTSTGKSVLAKLITIFRDNFLLLSLKEIETVDFKKELKRYNIDFEISNTEISYYDGDKLLLELINDQIALVDVELKNRHLKEFEIMIDKIVVSQPSLNLDRKNFLQRGLEISLRNMYSTYVPAERILFSLIGNSLSGLWANNVALPECYKDFAAKYEVARKEINFSNYNFFDIEYNYNNGVDEIILNKVKVLLSQSSSGIQSLIPLLLVLDDEIKKYDGGYNKSFIVEEPELNLFPIKQKLLLNYIMDKASKKNLNLIITTHSPYILSSLDTLMLAKNTFNEHPDLKEEINSIVSKDKWIDYDDISVYEVRNDGKVYSIKNEEFRSIDTNAIDGVSDIISEEFDKLTALRYAH